MNALLDAKKETDKKPKKTKNKTKKNKCKIFLSRRVAKGAVVFSLKRSKNAITIFLQIFWRSKEKRINGRENAIENFFRPWEDVH